MISKKIYYVWLGGKEMPLEQKECMKSWSKFCPDYQIIRLDENTYNLDECPMARYFYDKGIYAFAASAIRFDVLSKNSGFYLDTDIELVKSLDCLLDMPSFVCKQDETYIPNEISSKGRFLLNNAFLGSNEDDKSIFNMCLSALEIAKDKKIAPAQAMNIPLLAKNPSTKNVNETEVFKDCAYMTQDTIILPDMLMTNATIGIHYANLSWKKQWEASLKEKRY